MGRTSCSALIYNLLRDISPEKVAKISCFGHPLKQAILRQKCKYIFPGYDSSATMKKYDIYFSKNKRELTYF